MNSSEIINSLSLSYTFAVNVRRADGFLLFPSADVMLSVITCTGAKSICHKFHAGQFITRYWHWPVYRNRLLTSVKNGDCGVLDCDTLYSCRWISNVRRNVLQPFPDNEWPLQAEKRGDKCLWKVAYHLLIRTASVLLLAVVTHRPVFFCGRHFVDKA